ncbi:MAG: glycosyltransferase family 2 protein, partial [Flavobacteriaceae bacterium]|nr:glycosyltransferase family 2 protein [Flavobacteriaceae bacterium]
LPADYLINVDSELNRHYTDCFGGPDAAHSSFSRLQKGINFAMTSFLSTGGIRGSERARKSFQPRSFNMGLSKKAFLSTGGFGNIHPGEDPDLVLRLHKKGFKTQFIEKAYVYHKRRISWSKFAKQVYKFGKVRPILNQWHPHSRKLVFWLPTLFLLGFLTAITVALVGFPWLLYLYGFYFILIFITALTVERDLLTSTYSVIGVFIQLICYGYGFLISTLLLIFSGKEPKALFPELFFENAKKL